MSSTQFLQLFTYASNWDIMLNLVFVAIALVYILLTGPMVKYIPGATPVSGLHRFSFIMGLMFFYFAEGSPLKLLSHELFSMHMTQMTIMYIVMPPLLLLGIPGWFVRPLLKIKVIQLLMNFFTKPLIILFIFNGLLSIYHVPAVFDMIMGSHLYHNIAHSILLITALLMWWPVICPVEEMDKMKPLHKLGYIFANGILLTPACALIMFGDATIYSMYSQVSPFSFMTPLQDQQTGGVIMKITQEVVYITAIALVFSRWFREQRAQDEKELLEWKKSQLATDKP
ncbi:cytochrome c oxidase assembly protein [Shimazuella kribbensis]|uniref:cytochrome c oxidase assembly protein n=1 Tax=Shimazuella kribbensis TaxID=139808 RepID=UPI00040A2DE7|nr:cytochrome c oxidase assembly protein [Shimazuella kribbensis]